MSSSLPGRPPLPTSPPQWAPSVGETLRQSLDTLARGVFDNAPDGILVVDRQGRLLAANPALQRLAGYREDELRGQPLDLLLPLPARATHAQRVHAFFDAPHPRPMGHVPNLMLRRADGSLVPVDVALGVAMWHDEPCAVAFVRDVTEQRRLIEELSNLAAHDVLTGLLNRSQLLTQLRAAVAAAQRHGHTAALLLLDLDDFKGINDSYGHPVGDRVLQ